jgi:hypothetical protein
MMEWKPLVVRDILTRPYHDPLSYFAFWFAVFFGLIGLLSLGLNAGQLASNYRVSNK